jgi:hypothetical protein
MYKQRIVQLQTMIDKTPHRSNRKRATRTTQHMDLQIELSNTNHTTHGPLNRTEQHEPHNVVRVAQFYLKVHVLCGSCCSVLFKGPCVVWFVLLSSI